MRAILDAARRGRRRAATCSRGACTRSPARRSPSWSRSCARRLPTHPRGEGSEYDIYPPELWEPYRSRRFKCGEDLYATIGVTREDKLARLLQFARNYEFFGAPVGLFFCIDRRMGPPQWSDLGMYMQSVMLLAREHGLRHLRAGGVVGVVSHGRRVPADCRRELMLFSGMALGYRDESAPINTLQHRACAARGVRRRCAGSEPQRTHTASATRDGRILGRRRCGCRHAGGPSRRRLMSRTSPCQASVRPAPQAIWPFVAQSARTAASQA
ncbi:MAG: hypothetical protein MZV49_06065 [Rhodopseudomonas palustris]|nr:hypothetical protein [Rhodopseudomonas palustris]